MPAKASSKSPSRASSAPTKAVPHLPAKASKRRTCRSKACPRRRPQDRHREQALLPQKQSRICPRRRPNAEPVGARLAREGVLKIAIASKLCSHKAVAKAVAKTFPQKAVPHTAAQTLLQVLHRQSDACPLSQLRTYSGLQSRPLRHSLLLKEVSNEDPDKRSGNIPVAGPS